MTEAWLRSLLMSRKSVPAEIKDLGRKARSRLEEERAKRKEIVRIDEPEQPRPQHATLPAVQQRLIAPPTRIARKRKQYHTTKHPSDSTKYDTWIPSISNLTKSADDVRSTTVQLHGIPRETTPAAVLRFFDGLDPVSIYLLPTMKSKIIGLDADYSVIRRDKGLRVPRHDHSLRLCVKFQSAPVAKLAADRSQEGLQVNEGSAALAVTQLSKPLASYLSKYLAFEPSDPNQVLSAALDQVESKLDSWVIDVLWDKVICELGLKVENGSRNISEALFCHVGDPKQQTDHDKLSQHQTHLRATYCKLVNQLPFPSAELIDPCLAQNPILRLKSRAAECLQEEMSRIDELLLQARRWKMFFP